MGGSKSVSITRVSSSVMLKDGSSPKLCFGEEIVKFLLVNLDLNFRSL